MSEQPRRARHAACLLTALAVAAACAPVWPTLHAAAPVSPASAYECATAQAKALGFTPTNFDRDAYDLEARRQDRAAPDLRSQPDRRYEVLVVQARGGGASGGSTLHVQPGNIVRHFTREGWQEERIAPNAGARAAADTLIARCAAALPANAP